jgi:DNA-directed RNA polymerase subunit RPC12/RpoP
MPVIILRLPKYDITSTGRPPICPHCGSQILQSWGISARNIQDVQQKTTSIHRYRCTACGRTFRNYPQGVDRAIQTHRLRKIAAIAWVMGVSSRDVVNVFHQLGIELSHMTVWREGRELARQLQDQEEHEAFRKYALDRVFLPGVSSRFGVVVVIDLGIGERVVLGTLDEFNPRPVKSWLELLVQDTGFEVAIAETDYLTSPAALPLAYLPAPA